MKWMHNLAITVAQGVVIMMITASALLLADDNPQINSPLLGFSDDVVHINLLSEANVKQNRVYVSDISTCESSDQDLCQVIGNIDLGSAPAPAEAKILTIEEIKRIFGKELEPDVKVEFGPTTRTRLNTEYLIVDRQQIENFVRDYIFSKLAKQKSVRLTNVKVSNTRGLSIFPGQQDLVVPEISAGFWDQPVWLAEQIAGRHVWTIRNILSPNQNASVKFSVQIEMERYLPTVKNVVSIGKTIDASDLEWRWIHLNRLNKDAVAEIKDAVGKKSRIEIRPGAVISSRSLVMPKAVQRGEVVRLIIHSGELSLAGEATALGSGSVGESVHLYYAATKKNITGRIVGDKTVEVSL